MPQHPLPEGSTPDRLLVATDLDGTLLSSSGRVGERTKGVLRRARALGAVVVMATSRPLHDTERLVGPIADFLVCSSGAVTVDTACSGPVHREAFGHHSAVALCTSLRSAIPDVHLGLDLPTAVSWTRGSSWGGTARKEPPRHTPRGQRSTPHGDEHVPARVPRPAVGFGLVLLVPLVATQHPDRGMVQRQRAAARRALGRRLHQPAPRGLELPGDAHHACHQVDVAPPQTHRLAAAQPAMGPFGHRLVGPHHRPRAPPRFQPQPSGGVGRQQPFTHSGVQSRPQGGAHPLYRGWGASPPRGWCAGRSRRTSPVPGLMKPGRKQHTSRGQPWGLSGQRQEPGSVEPGVCHPLPRPASLDRALLLE